MESFFNWDLLKISTYCRRYLSHVLCNRASLVMQSFATCFNGITCFYWEMFLNRTGLFHRSISQSGNFYNPWTLTSPGIAKMRAITVGKHLGCSTKNSKELIECLRTKSAEEIIGTDNLFKVMKFICYQKIHK